MNRLAATPLAAALLLAGCASTQTGAEWIDPQFQNITLRGTRVMVVCEAADLPVRKLCQDVLAAEVTARGATPVIGPDGLATGERPLAEAYQGAIAALRMLRALACRCRWAAAASSRPWAPPAR